MDCFGSNEPHNDVQQVVSRFIIVKVGEDIIYLVLALKQVCKVLLQHAQMLKLPTF